MSILRLVFQRLGKLAIVVVLVFSTGGHWLFLQSVAWVSMTLQLAQNNPLPVALEKTFDGRHPCNLCKAVAEGKKEERKQDTLQVKPKLELFFELKSAWVAPLLLPRPAFTFVDVFQVRFESPPTPPPRAA